MENCLTQNKTEMYQQCTLEKKEGEATITRTIWGPSKYTQVDKIVKVQEDNGQWTEGWRVKAVHGNPLPKSYVVHQSHAHTRQRQASDI